MPSTIHCDVAIAGGGLAGSLIALALQRRHPEMDVRLVEAGPSFGGNHVWSFFGSDVADTDRWLVAPLVAHGWPGYDVAFPNRERRLNVPYYSITSERLDEVVRATLPKAGLMARRKVLAAGPTAIVLADGDRLQAKGVIDARGSGDLSLLECGWQKFVGRDYALTEPHELTRPTVMDARVEQIDGYRFVYVLPFAATQGFVEDTYFSDGPELDRAAVAARCDAYAAAAGWAVERVVREEMGVLPIALAGDFDAYWQSGGNKVAKAGMRAGLFQPATGYSLPDAVRLAARIADATDFSGAGLHALTHGFAKSTWRARGFYRMLNKMLFRAAEPDARRAVIERFYGLGPGLVRRFYSGQSTFLDKARILSGKPPVPVGAALKAIAR